MAELSDLSLKDRLFLQAGGPGPVLVEYGEADSEDP